MKLLNKLASWFKSNEADHLSEFWENYTNEKITKTDKLVERWVDEINYNEYIEGYEEYYSFFTTATLDMFQDLHDNNIEIDDDIVYLDNVGVVKRILTKPMRILQPHEHYWVSQYWPVIPRVVLLLNDNTRMVVDYDNVKYIKLRD